MTINLYATSIFFLASLLGLIAHWYNKKRRDEISGNLMSYLIADYPGRSLSTITVLICTAFAAVQTGAADSIDIRMIIAQLQNGNLYMPSVNGLIGAFTIGWVLDSSINKGAA
jgi:hypothetical protein